MRALISVVLALCACATSQPAPPPAPPPAPAATPAAPAVPAPPAVEHVTQDTPKTTTTGNRFVAPGGWSISVRGAATILAPPEPEAHIALVDVQAKDAESAVKAAWKIYKPDASWPLIDVRTAPDREGWSDVHVYVYQTSPNEKRSVAADARRAGNGWTVLIFDMPDAVAEKRAGQVGVIFSRLQPKGYERESFAGKKANPLDAARIAALGKFIENGIKQSGVPGVAVGLVQDGKVVFAGGFGVRELGKPAKVDGDSLFMIASNTKAMTTLMLAKLVDEKKISWDQHVTELLPSFKLGSADTTRKVLVKHLICACTGLPRQDFEWLFQFKGMTPESALATLATMQPTSEFGEMFQYSNPLAAAAGFIGGHVAFPKLELGAAYDRAMKTRVFDPLGMKATTFDYARALRGNHAMPHAPDIDGKMAAAPMEINYAAIPMRPAGAAWSSVRDVLKYVQMELDQGTLPGSKRYVEKETLLERRKPQVAIGKDATYGMGLMVDRTWGIPVVHHGGDLIGYHSDMMWLPEHGVGAVILTNGNPGGIIRGIFQRKLLEVLFDGKPEADENLATAIHNFEGARAAERKLMTVPPDPADAAKLAPHYVNEALGDITVSHAGPATTFDFGEWKSEVASRHNPDGTVSFLTTRAGIDGFEFVVGKGEKRTLIVRDGQHEYVFTEK